MALTNFILTVVGVGAAVMLLRSDVKQSATIFRRNVRHIRNWLEEESAAAAKYARFCLLLNFANLLLALASPSAANLMLRLVWIGSGVG
ncbi:hypothetical protein PR202_gb01821 [Eleusine coracana subsp. coracana]|uniref:Uncharacterized protein n=1 Tax=Eleusine coracana subsp. coracana TaxID=191504 RepID=A0AAV5DWV2_ELECO|nr:hypothetical protein PR202_gb01821 [Eleusine coracana subsp. coracana]